MTPGPEAAISEGSAAGEALGAGRYVVVGSLGAGSQGETLDAIDKREGRPVAIKRFRLQTARSWKDVELAEREATVLASLNHPGLPRYIDHFEENGALYLVMEKFEGETLHSRRKRGALLDNAQVVRFLREAAACLKYLHAQSPPVVHRDIKPGNVILRPDGSYGLVDFGSVRDRLKPEGGSTVVGTFGYMAPEQFQGRARPSSDVYAVGATALSMLTGREPEDLPHRGLAVDVEAAVGGYLDRRLVSVLRALLEPDPDRRVGSVEEALWAAGLGEGPRTPGEKGPARAAAAKAARRARIQAEEEQRIAELVSEHARRKAESRARQLDRKGRRQAEREERWARKAARRAERYARRYAVDRHGAGRPLPPFVAIGIVVLLALRVASVATFALFQVLLPLLFTFFYSPRKRERMFEIGQAGQRGLARARAHVRQQFFGRSLPGEFHDFTRESDASHHGPPGERVATASSGPASPSRQRVSIDAEVTDLEHDDAWDVDAAEVRDEHRRQGK